MCNNIKNNFNFMKGTKKNTKKYRKNKSKKNRDRFYNLKKSLGELYNIAMSEKIHKIYKNKNLNKYEKERFAYVYSFYRSGCYQHLDTYGNIDFNDKWFPESEEDSINAAIKSLESLNWKNENAEEIKFYEMKELNTKYSDDAYKKNLYKIHKFSKLN